MLAFKGFNKDLQATLGKGTYQFKPNKTYTETECKCASTGFHCAENPLCALSYYSGLESRYFIVKAEGDINQDGNGSRISCTKITLLKEISRIELAAYGCKYMAKYPERETESKFVMKNSGKCNVVNDFVIVRGKSPKAAGVKGSYFFLVQEEKGSKEIKIIYPVYVDGEEIRENTFYGLRGDNLCVRKNLKS